MANGHASNEPETTRTELNGTESRREAVMMDGLQVSSKNRETQTKLTRKNEAQE